MAGLLTGRDALLRTTPRLAVLAVDMPHAHAPTRSGGCCEAAPATTARCSPTRTAAASSRCVVDTARLDAVRPDLEDQHGLPLHRLLAPLDLVEVPPLGDEHRDVDTWADLRDLRSERREFRQTGLRVRAGSLSHLGLVNLHDWIDELCDVLDIEAEVDEGWSLDLAEVAGDNVERAAGAGDDVPPRRGRRRAGRRPGGGREAGRPGAGAGRGLGPTGRTPRDPRRHLDDDVPDDSAVDHTDDVYAG